MVQPYRFRLRTAYRFLSPLLWLLESTRLVILDGNQTGLEELEGFPSGAGVPIQVLLPFWERNVICKA